MLSHHSWAESQILFVHFLNFNTCRWQNQWELHGDTMITTSGYLTNVQLFNNNKNFSQASKELLYKWPVDLSPRNTLA